VQRLHKSRERSPAPDTVVSMSACMFKQSRHDLKIANKAYLAFATNLQRAREIVHWLVSPDAEISFWDACDGVDKSPDHMRKWLLDGLDPTFVRIAVGNAGFLCPCCGKRA
jgi:hypothetical protein